MLSQDQSDTWNTVFTAGLSKGFSSKRRGGKWKCKLDEMLIGDYLITPLTSAKMLKSESYWMQNCCRDFTDPCLDHCYCIFSIRSRSGERLATLGLKNSQGYWHFDQCLGPANTNVLEETFEYLDEDDALQMEFYPTEIYYIAHEMVRLMNCKENSH